MNPFRTRLLGICTLISWCVSTTTLLCAQQPTDVKITHGPILGRVRSNGIKVWMRTSQPARIQASCSEQNSTPAASSDILSSISSTNYNHDFTGVVEFSGLNSDTKYRYTTYVLDGTKRIAGPSGTFRTLPAKSQYQNKKYNPQGLFNFKFEFGCGNNQDPGAGNGPSLPVYDQLLKNVKNDVHFAILNGDWLYEDQRDYPLSKWRSQVSFPAKQQLPLVLDVAPAITGVWENYKTYLSRGTNLAEWHRHVPSYYTFDDHELLDDIFGTGTPGFRDRRAVFRDIGVQAWYDYLGWSNPVDFRQTIHFGKGSVHPNENILVDKNADFTKLNLQEMGNLHIHWGGQNSGVRILDEKKNKVGGDPNAGVYEIVQVIDNTRIKIRPAPKQKGIVSYSIARRSYCKFQVSNCEFYLLDTRTHRDLHDHLKPENPKVSLLGTQQTEWLINSMKESSAEMIFIVSSVNFMIPHVGGGGVVAVDRPTKNDAWAAFLHERELLINLWDKLDKPVCVLTGDLHNSFAIKITDNVWEFASGPHNSVNHRPSDEGNRPVTGLFKSGPRTCEIRWSSIALPDIPRENRLFPYYCVVQINNVFNNPVEKNGTRWIAYPHPQVIFQFHDARTGELRYSETVSTLISSD